ncbi:MAG: glycosyltransferase family 9 protein [Candidatus Omnitrophica bacterium]|nr:glycosyltransferase family 9 protein [Candidatus Omnitrophota bacterium]
MKTDKNALVIRPGSLGDQIATIPVLTSLKKNHFNVYLAGNEKVNTFFEKKGIINRGIGFGDICLTEFFSEIKKIKIPGFPDFDLVICYIEKKEIFSRNLILTYGDKVVFHPLFEKSPCQITEFLLMPLKKMGLNIHYPETVKRDACDLLFIHPGSGSKKKNWPAENFVKVYRYFQRICKPKIILGECEISDYEFWKKNTDAPDLLIPKNLVELSQTLETGKWFIGNDSGVSHLAAFTGLKTFIIFGPTDPAIWAPEGKNVKIVSLHAGCSPCNIETRNMCANNICLQEIKIEHIISLVEKEIR